MHGNRLSDQLDRSHRRTWVTVLGITVAGAALRVNYAFMGGLWRDEAQALGIARMPTVRELVAFLAQHESHPPGYHLLLRGWTNVFGSSDASGLALSLLFGIALIPAVFLVTREMSSSRAGVLAAILVAVHPALFQYSASIRPYSLLSLLVLGLLRLLWRLLRAPNRSLIVGYAGLALALVYVHHWSWLVVAAAGLLWLVLGVRARGAAELGRITSVHGLVALGYGPWIPSLLYQMKTAGHPQTAASPLDVLPRSLFAMTALPPLAATLLLAMSLWVFVSQGRATPVRNRESALGLSVGLPMITAGLTAALLPWVNLTTLWCYSIVAPSVVVAIALMIGQTGAGHLAFRTLSVQAGWVGVMALTCGALLFAPRANTREVAEYVRSHSDESDRLIVVPGYIVPSFQRYFGPGRQAHSLPEDSLAPYIRYDHRLARDLDPRPWARLMAVIDTARQQCDRLWVVVEAGTPAHMEKLVAAMLKAAEHQLGPAEVVQSSFPQLGVLEHSSIHRYTACRGKVTGLPE